MKPVSARFIGFAALAWWQRHIAVLLLAVVGTYAFLESRPDWSPMHRWNRAFGDVSLIFLAVSMAIGPASRLRPLFRKTIPWRREFGIYGVILAVIHTVIVLAGWVEWDLFRLFGYEIHPQTGRYVMLQHGFGLANSIGIVALLYGIALAITSNDRSQKLLGASVWKFFQQGAYVLWMLSVVHAAYFFYLHFLHFHVRVPDPNWAQLPFIGLVGLVVALQCGAFFRTWRRKQMTVRN